MSKNKKIRIELGDVYAIPLPDGKYGFGRIFEDGFIAIYEYIGKDLEDTPIQEKYQFMVGVYDQAIRDDGWIKVENRPFENKEDAWPPPQCIIDIIDGSHALYYKCEIRQKVSYKGKIINANEHECKGMEEAAVWHSNHIIDRIMGIDIWHK